MKNAHGVEPTRYMKRKESKYAIICDHGCGPIFGNYDGYNIYIDDHCNRMYNCFIKNDGERGYDCHPEYKSSLFVNTGKPEKKNMFSVLDYEVFGIDYESKYSIDHLYKHPDIMMEYIETKDISEQALKQLDDDTELLNDLDTISCDDSNIRLKISHYYFKNPSKLLPNTQIVNQQYDDKLREWCGDYEWKLLYRASEHEYTARFFHKCCDDVKGPTLVIIKSSGGWLFGGYTTQSWSGDGIYIMV